MIKYSKRCKTCQFMKKDKKFRERIYKSTYFFPDSHENIVDILDDYGGPLSVSMVYRHLKDHKFAQLLPDRKKAISEKRIQNETKDQATELAKAVIGGEMIEKTLLDKQQHIQALDTYISQFRDEVLKGKVKITAANGLAAIKIRADIEKGQKDRTKDIIASLIMAGAPKNGS